MSLDLTKPAPGTKPKSAEIRDNFTALKTLVDGLTAQIAAIPAGPPGIQGPPGVTELPPAVASIDPITASPMDPNALQTTIARLNQLICALTGKTLPGAATNPAPPDGWTNTPQITKAVSWTSTEGMNANVYFGTAPDNLQYSMMNTMAPAFIIQNSLPGGLQPNTTYWWRVDVVTMMGGIIPGPLWSFTTEP